MPIELDPFRTALALGLVVGALAILLPYLDSLVVALVALAIAGWASRHRPGAAAPAPLGVGTMVAWLSVGAGAVAFALAPSPWTPVRALGLAASLLPLGWAEFSPRRARHASGTAAP
ncbi:MAG TPA: hypothetical protein VMC82_01795 [Thermoplasmata archaeon]|nr:hypothetical protein [Thermoplasmata archaeon]